MSGKVRNIGTLRIDGVSYQLVPNGEGWTYTYTGVASVSQQTSPEEQILASAPPGYKRTVGWLDWTAGTVGPDIYSPNMKYLASGEGPQTELARKIVRPMQKRRVELSSAKGRVIDFFEFDFHDGTTGLYVVQAGGVVRRITTGLNAESIAAQKTTVGTGGGDSAGVTLTTRTLTEASPPWTWSIGGGNTRTGVLLGAKDAAVVRCYESASTAGLLVWEEDTGEASGGVNHNPVRFTHWTTGVYSNEAVGGEYLWASTAPNFVPDVGGTATKQAIWPLIQEQDPFIWDNWVAEISPLSLDPGLHRITGIAALRDMIVITTSVGTVYRVKTDAAGGVPAPVLDRRAAVPDPDNGRTMRVWNGRLFVPTPRGLFMYVEFDGQVGGTLVSVGPECIKGHNGPIRGHSVIYGGDPEWLYAAFWNGTDSYILKGRIPEQGEEAPGRMIWHSACAYIPNERVTALHVTSPNASTNPILCIGTQTNPTGTQLIPSVHFVTLPRPGKTVLTDGNLRFDVSGLSATLPDHDCMLANIKKTFMRVSVTSHNVSAINSIDIYARIDESQWARVGSIKDSPIADLSLPRNLTGYKLGLKLVFLGNDNTVPSFVQAVGVDFVAHMPSSKFIDCDVFIAQGQTVVTGANQYSGMSRVALLELLKDSSRLLAVVGPDGIERQAQFDKTVGLTWSWVDQATPDAQSGFRAKFRLNIYDDFVLQRAALYDTDPYTEGTFVSYYDMTG